MSQVYVMCDGCGEYVMMVLHLQYMLVLTHHE